MNNLRQSIRVLLMTIVSITFLTSCDESSTSASEEAQLKGFALGGIYFIDGYGGMNSVEIMLSSQGLSSNDELLEGYKTYLEFPFDTSQASECQSYLQDFWEIGDKAALLKQLDVLKNREHKYKAWDYARSVNLNCNAFAAGYLTKSEVLTNLSELLPLAQSKYESWEAYYEGYNQGLKDWDPESDQVISFARVTKEILSNEKSIYNILPLN